MFLIQEKIVAFWVDFETEQKTQSISTHKNPETVLRDTFTIINIFFV